MIPYSRGRMGAAGRALAELTFGRDLAVRSLNHLLGEIAASPMTSDTHPERGVEQPALGRVDIAVMVDPATVAPGFRHLTRQSLIFGLGALTGKATGLVLLPIFTRVLSPDDYGRLDVLWSLGSGMAGVLLLGLDAAAVRLYFDQPDVRGRGRLLATWAVLLGAIAAVATIALLATGPTIGGLLFGSASAAGAGLVLALVVPAALVNHYALTGLRTTGQPAAYAAFTVATFAVYAIGILALLGLGQASVRTIMVAWGAALTLTGVGGVLRLRNRLHGGTSRRLAVGLLSMDCRWPRFLRSHSGRTSSIARSSWRRPGRPRSPVSP